MSKGTETLDELLSDPIIRLLMARDRVRPEDVRMLLAQCAARTADSIGAACHRPGRQAGHALRLTARQ